LLAEDSAVAHAMSQVITNYVPQVTHMNITSFKCPILTRTEATLIGSQVKH
jgi:hypothetical protein